MKQVVSFLKLFTVLAFLAVAAGLLGRLASTELVGTARVMDGDSLTINGQEVRLFGIDAPEYRQTCATGQASADEYPCGARAAAHLRDLTGNVEIRCVGQGHDKYQRLLAVCYRDGQDLNAVMVADGWAVAFGDYEGHEAVARERSLGLWRGDFVMPSEWRRRGSEKHRKGWLSSVFGW